MYAMIDDELLTGVSFYQFRKLVSERKEYDSECHSDTTYRWYRSDYDLIHDRPAKIIVNRGSHSHDFMEEE